MQPNCTSVCKEKIAKKQADKNTPSIGGEITPVDGFSLSVASYVVKDKAVKLKCRKMCRNQEKIWPFLLERPDFVELLGGFEPPTSSLPNSQIEFFITFSVYL